MIGRRAHDDAQSFDEAWSGRAPRDEHIADLVQFAEGLCEAAAAEPTTAFRESLRTQLMAEAATTLVPTPAKTRTIAAPVSEMHPVRRRVACVTAAFVASAGVIGIVSSSATAVPGEMLYSVKRTVESAELKLHRDDASRGSFQLAQASERLAEARELSSAGSSDALIAETLDDFAAQATSGSGKLFASFADSGEEESVRKVNDFAAAASVNLSELSQDLSPGTDDAFAAATRTVSALATEASSLCKACAPADVQALVSAVTNLAGQAPASKPAAPEVEKSSKSKSADKPSGTSGSTPDAPAVAPSPAPVVVPTAPPASAPSLADVTDPVVGALLGDESQKGIVPGLLNGLLGSK